MPTFNEITVAQMALSALDATTILSFPNLTGSLDTFSVTNCPALTTIDLPVFASVAGAGKNFECYSNAALTSISPPLLASVGGSFICSNCTSLTTLTVPSLTATGDDFGCDGCTSLVTLDVTALISVANCNFSNCTSLTTLDLPTLTTVGGDISSTSNTSMTAVDLSALTSTGGSVFFQDCTSLVTINFGAGWVPSDNAIMSWNNCALDQATVDFILNACANAGLAMSNIDLSGGTNSTPSAAGLVDKATLIGNGCTVTTN